jgi:hypothetical protein
MKLIAVADLHGKEDRLLGIADHVKAYQADVLVVAGDIAGRRTAVRVVERLSRLSIPVLVVKGNSDASLLTSEMRKYNNLIDLHLKQTRIAGVPFIGLSGTVPLPFYNKIRLREGKLLHQLEQMVTIRGILVTHTPPRGSVDKVLGRFHAGSSGLRRLVENLQPLLVICGHIHEAAGVVYRGTSCIINCSIGSRGNGVMVELTEEGTIRKITEL